MKKSITLCCKCPNEKEDTQKLIALGYTNISHGYCIECALRMSKKAPKVMARLKKKNYKFVQPNRITLRGIIK